MNGGDQNRRQDRLSRAEKMLGVCGWAGSEDTIPVGDAVKGCTISDDVHGDRQLSGDRRDPQEGVRQPAGQSTTRPYWQRDVYAASPSTGTAGGLKASRKAQTKYGKGKVMTGEQIRWGL